ncbi:MAG: hypothetical protein ACYTAS_19135 [Planctomycetota bacterium]|jgi:hypothetical protein
MNRETVRTILLTFLSLFRDMGYQTFNKTTRSGMEVQLSLSALIQDLQVQEEGAMQFVDEIVKQFGSDQERQALVELSEAIRQHGGPVMGEPHVASALRQAEALLGIKVHR